MPLGLLPAGAMERVEVINIQRLLEAAEYLERRERGNCTEEGLRVEVAPPLGRRAGKRCCCRARGFGEGGGRQAAARAVGKGRQLLGSQAHG